MKVSAAVVAAMLVAMTALAVSPAQPVDLTPLFRQAGLAIDELKVVEVGGVVLIRGTAASRSVAEEAGRIAIGLGYSRVANLIHVVPPPDDDVLARIAERELTRNRSLDGCTFRVAADRGVVRIAGTVRNNMQKDYAIEVLRNIDGVREVQADLRRR
jgi:osmotically-inducible protein OsmY